jgi:opacity protein-like surface antigen
LKIEENREFQILGLKSNFNNNLRRFLMRKSHTLTGISFVEAALVFFFIIVFSVVLFAQDGEKDHRYGGYARLHAMGDNPYIVDPDNIKLNPAYSSLYQNFLWGDIGSSVANPEDGYGQFAGFNYGFNKDLNLGLLLTRNDFMPSYSIGALDSRNLVGQINGNVPGANIVPMDNNLELFGSYDFGSFVLGLGLAYASTTNNYNPDAGGGDKNSANQFGVNLGLLTSFSSSFKFDAAVSLIFPSATYEPGAVGADKVEGSNTDLMINARGFWRLSSKVSLVPNAAFYSSTGSYKVGGLSSDLPSWSGILIGVGLNYKVGDLLIAGGPSFMYESETIASTQTSPEEKNSWTTFPAWNLGAEWYLTDWLIGRLGYVASTYSYTDQTQATISTVNERTFTNFSRGDVRLGVGFRFGGFTLDATVNDDALREGFNLIGGGTHTFAYLSASYAF